MNSAECAYGALHSSIVRVVAVWFHGGRYHVDILFVSILHNDAPVVYLWDYLHHGVSSVGVVQGRRLEFWRMIATVGNR